jgi:hypothetical protein
MLKSHLRFAGAVACMGVCGCSTLQIRNVETEATTPISLEKALLGFESDLSNMHLAVLSNASGATGGCTPPHAAPPECWTKAAQSLLETIKYAQCYDVVDPHAKNKVYDRARRTRNPLVPTANGAVQLQVQGQFSEAGTFTVSATPSLGGTVTRQTQQQVMLPISLVSLATLPNFYIGQQLTNLQYTTLDPHNPVATSAVSDALSVARELQKIVAYSLAQLDTTTSAAAQDAYCHNHENGPQDIIFFPSVM